MIEPSTDFEDGEFVFGIDFFHITGEDGSQELELKAEGDIGNPHHRDLIVTGLRQAANEIEKQPASAVTVWLRP